MRNNNKKGGNEISDCTQVIVDIYSRFLFEKSVFEERKESALTVERIKELMLNAQKEAYGDGLDENYLHPYMWAWKPHYYDANYNYYNFPYAFGLLFAKGLYAEYLKKGSDFVGEYERLLSITGKNKILITTDAIGMGVNLPIKRIIFLSISKFDGEQMRELTSQEVKQIAGRAGRKGIYDTGYVATYRDNKEFIEERLEEEDISIKRAVLGPSDAILEIDNLPLNEKLALWSTKKCEVPYYRKMDISEYLIILERLKSYKLLEEIQWELLKIPFDISKDDLMNQFLNFVDQLFINDQEELFKPQCYSGTLYDLETYYQMVNMYYSFSKRFNLNFDLEWIENERLTVSEEINNILMRI